MIKVGVQNAGIMRGVCAARCCIQSSHLYSGLGFFPALRGHRSFYSLVHQFLCALAAKHETETLLWAACFMFVCCSVPQSQLRTYMLYHFIHTHFFPQTLFLTKQTHLPGDKSVSVSIVLLIVSRSFRL